MSSRKMVGYEELSPYSIIRSLDLLAFNNFSENIKNACGDIPIEPWQLLEEGAFYFFRQILMLKTIKLGENTLFEREPEGIVLINRGPCRCAILYECKTRKDGYRISSDDVLRYKSYIQTKREEIRVRHNLMLTNFVIISSEFMGEYEERIKEIEVDGITVSLLHAKTLTDLSDQAYELGYDDIQLLNIQKILNRGIVQNTPLKNCLI